MLDVYKMCRDMERDYKFSIGEDLKKDVKRLLKNVYHANRLTEKLNYILSAREVVEDIRLDLRVLRELGKIQENTFVDMNAKLEDISKQLANWYKKQNSKNTSSTEIDEVTKNTSSTEVDEVAKNV